MTQIHVQDPESEEYITVENTAPEEVRGMSATQYKWIRAYRKKMARTEERELSIAEAAIHLLARASWLGEVKPEDGEVGVLRGTVTSETLAELSVGQNGRHAAGGAPTIVWHDRGARSQVAGGEVELADGTKVEVVACERGAEVWLPVEAVQRAAACPDDASFDAAYAAARRVKGFA